MMFAYLFKEHFTSSNLLFVKDKLIINCYRLYKNTKEHFKIILYSLLYFYTLKHSVSVAFSLLVVVVVVMKPSSKSKSWNLKTRSDVTMKSRKPRTRIRSADLYMCDVAKLTVLLHLDFLSVLLMLLGFVYYHLLVK